MAPSGPLVFVVGGGACSSGGCIGNSRAAGGRGPLCRWEHWQLCRFSKSGLRVPEAAGSLGTSAILSSVACWQPSDVLGVQHTWRRCLGHAWLQPQQGRWAGASAELQAPLMQVAGLAPLQLGPLWMAGWLGTRRCLQSQCRLPLAACACAWTPTYARIIKVRMRCAG